MMLFSQFDWFWRLEICCRSSWIQPRWARLFFQQGRAQAEVKCPCNPPSKGITTMIESRRSRRGLVQGRIGTRALPRSRTSLKTCGFFKELKSPFFVAGAFVQLILVPRPSLIESTSFRVAMDRVAASFHASVAASFNGPVEHRPGHHAAWGRLGHEADQRRPCEEFVDFAHRVP